MKSFFFVAVALQTAALFGGGVYLNNTTDTGNTLQYQANGFTAIGDQITLGGTNRLAVDATTEFYNAGPVDGTFDATLSLFSTGANPGGLGSLLGSFTVTNISINTNDIADVTFSGLNTVVPNNLIFILTVANVVNADLGITLFDPPSLGSSSNNSFISNDGTGFSVNSTGQSVDNLNFVLDANAATTTTPEPATMTLIGGGVALLALFGNRKK